MSTQPEALRLADALDAYHTRSCHKEAAAELRRLHQEHEEDQKVIAVWRGRTQRAEAQRDALLEALRAFVKQYGSQDVQAWMRVRDEAIAAIKAAEEKT